MITCSGLNLHYSVEWKCQERISFSHSALRWNAFSLLPLSMILLLLLLLSHFSPTLCDPIDGSPPGSPVPGILQTRTLEWVAVSFSNAWKWKVKVKSLNHARLLVTPWTAAYQAPPSMGFSRQQYWSGVPLPSPKFIVRHIYLVSFLWPDPRGLQDFSSLTRDWTWALAPKVKSPNH